MSKARTKEGRQDRVRERDVLRRAATVAGLPLMRRSVRSLVPPRPDVSCRIAGRPTYFEITRMAHAGSANAMGRHLSELRRRDAAQPLAPDTYDDRMALRDALARKATKRYIVGKRPLCLLVWVDGVFHPQGMPPAWADAILREVGPASRWSRILVFDRPRDRIVASWSRDAG